MPLRFLLDEHLRGPLWRAIQRRNATGEIRIDATRVGDLPDLPLGAGDREILVWAEREERILITADKSTMVQHLEEHLRAGRRSPGIFMILPGAALRDVLEFIALASLYSDPEEWRDRIEFLR